MSQEKRQYVGKELIPYFQTMLNSIKKNRLEVVSTEAPEKKHLS